MNRPARFTVADLRRAAQVVKELGREWCVEIKPDGTIGLAQGRVDPQPVPELEERKGRVL